MTFRHFVATVSMSMMVVLAGACASTGTQTLPTLEQRLAGRGLMLGDEVERIPDYRVDGWNRLGDTHVIINGGVSRRYLLTLMQPCPDLAGAETLAFSTTASALTPFDTLIVESPIGPRRCQISEIRALERAGDAPAAASDD